MASSPSRSEIDHQDRIERGAQFVAEHRDEMILGRIGVAQLLVEPRILRRGRRARGEVFGKGQVRLGEMAARFRGDESDGAEDALVGDERHDHRRGQAEAAEQGEVLGIARDVLQERRRRNAGRSCGLPERSTAGTPTGESGGSG